MRRSAVWLHAGAVLAVAVLALAAGCLKAPAEVIGPPKDPSTVQWREIQVLPAKGGRWTDVCFRGEKGWLVGTMGSVARTADGGATWTTGRLSTEDTPTPASDGAMRVAFGDDERGFAFGSSVFVTTDGGVTWRWPADGWLGSSDVVSVMDMCFPSDRVGYAIGWTNDRGQAAGRFLRSTDGGRSWSADDRPGSLASRMPFYRLHFQDDRRGIALGWFSAVTRDGADTWALGLPMGDSSSLKDVAVGPGHAQVAIVDSDLEVTSDDFATRSRVSLGATQTLVAVDTDRDGSFIVIGARGGVWRSKDGGKTWARLDGPPSPGEITACRIVARPGGSTMLYAVTDLEVVIGTLPK